MKRLFFLFLLIGCQTAHTGNVVDPICPICEEKAMIISTASDWFITPSGDLLFSILLLNYGYINAIDIKVTCSLVNADTGEEEVTLSEWVGGMDATTTIYKEIKTSAELTSSSYYSVCHPSDCADCELLNKRIPGFEIVSGTK